LYKSPENKGLGESQFLKKEKKKRRSNHTHQRSNSLVARSNAS